jgi:hypothetical protein
MRRHGVPATITSTGRVTSTWLPGEDDTLTGLPRMREAWRRLRHHHGRLTTARLVLAAWRHGFVLS